MSDRRAGALCVLLLAASACKDKPAARPAEPEQRRAEEAREVEAELARQPELPGPEPVPLAVPEENRPPSAAQLPVPEDFLPETAATILRANYLSELEKLETEVRADEN